MITESATLDQDDPGARGAAHGELWRAAIRDHLEVRRALAAPRWDRAQQDALAAQHLAALVAFSPDLAAELHGIARGAGLTPEAALLLNLDLRHVPAPGVALAADDPIGGAAIYAPTPAGPLLAQTWDAPRALAEYVRALHLRPRGGGGEQLLLTLAGCLGLAGLAATGLGVACLDLTCADSPVGPIGPALVRHLLAAASARDALARAELAPRGGGRFFMLADGRDYFGLEQSGAVSIATQRGPRAAHLHAGHAFDPVIRRVERLPPGSAAFRRMELASTFYVQRRPRDPAALWDLLASHEGSPRSLCAHPDDPWAPAACGRIVMDLGGGRVLLGRGCGAAAAPLELRLARDRNLSAEPASP